MAQVRALTRGPKHHFFGYYGLGPWDRALRFHLALETDFDDRCPTAADGATVGLVDTQTGAFAPCARTRAFNFQQGSMMHWIDSGGGEEFTFNDWEESHLVARAVSPGSGAVRTLGRAIAAVSPTQPLAIGLNYARLALCRPVVGYAGEPGAGGLVGRPEDDGLFLVDLASGESRLALSIAEVIRVAPKEEVPDGPAWFNHVFFNTDGGRLFFLCRVKKQHRLAKRGRPFHDSLWTVRPDGSDLVCQIPFGHVISHFDWRDERRILVSSDVLGRGMQFVEFTDGAGDFEPVGEGVLPADGHACFSPDRRWLVCDTYPQGPGRLSELMLYRLADGVKISLGKFHSPKPYGGEFRCDLHPRWRPDGSAVSFDSIHEGSRQIYVADISEITRRAQSGDSGPPP